MFNCTFADFKTFTAEYIAYTDENNSEIISISLFTLSALLILFFYKLYLTTLAADAVCAVE